MVYCEQDMCESKIGRLMQAFRADRPSEWQMDEFIGMAEEMHKEIERLSQAEKDAARYRSANEKAESLISYIGDEMSELLKNDYSKYCSLEGVNSEIDYFNKYMKKGDEAMKCNK